MAKKVRKSSGRLKPAEIAEIFDRFAAANPYPLGELAVHQPYTLAGGRGPLGTGDRCEREPGDRTLFELEDTPAKRCRARRNETQRICGAPSASSTPRRRTSSALSQLLIERHSGKVPRTREELQALPGAGRKTANVVLNVAFGRTNHRGGHPIFRVGNRTGLAPGKMCRLGRGRGSKRKCPDRSGAPITG